MEDAYVMHHDIGLDGVMKASIYAVIDGHGGEWCTTFLQRNLIKFVFEEFRAIDKNELLNKPFSVVLEAVFTKAYKNLDQTYYDRFQEVAKNSGAVAVCVFIFGSQIYCINLGDCRAVLCRGGKALELSQDHKAHLQSEIDRIKVRGGVVTCGRVAGRLAVSRAFGDHELKMQVDDKGIIHYLEYLCVQPELR